MPLRQYIPLLDWIRDYDRTLLRGDLAAGLTVGVMLIPQGMAYAMVAGLPPIYGLYAGIAPLIVYAFLGSSRHLSMGPAALVALLVMAGVSKLAQVGSGEYIALAILLALSVGTLQFLLGVFRLGFMVNFLSHPVISGFTSAAAILIALSQIKHVIGIEYPSGHHIQHIVVVIARQASNFHLPTMFVGLGAILFLWIIRRYSRRLPGALLVVLVGILVCWLGGLQEMGVAIVGDIPRGLPALQMPDLKYTDVRALLPAVLTISLMGYMESIVVAKAVQSKAKDYRIDSNQELIAQGMANIAGSFFQAFPVAGSFSRTAVNHQSGARTGISSIVAALLILLTLLLLTPLFYYLPKAVLGAVIVFAITGLFEWKEAVHLWKTDRRDFTMLLVTFLLTLTLGIETGIVTGVVLSLSLVIYSSSRPHYAVLGRLPGSTIYKNIARFPEAEEEEGVLIIRMDARLYFANLEYVRDALEKETASRPETELIIIDATSISTIDSSAVIMLQDLIRDFGQLGMNFRFLGLIGPVRDALRKNGLDHVIGEDHVYTRVHDAVEQFRHGGEAGPFPRRRRPATGVSGDLQALDERLKP